MMRTLLTWLSNHAWPKRRLMPTAQDAKNLEQQYSRIPLELIHYWIESEIMTNPQSTDPNICLAWAARCDFVTGIINKYDRAQNPGKYEEAVTQVGKFNPRAA